MGLRLRLREAAEMTLIFRSSHRRGAATLIPGEVSNFMNTVEEFKREAVPRQADRSDLRAEIIRIRRAIGVRPYCGRQEKNL